MYFADSYLLLFLFVFRAVIGWDAWGFDFLKAPFRHILPTKIGSTYKKPNTTPGNVLHMK